VVVDQHDAATVRVAEARDLDAMVALHVAAFPEFFLTSLGPRFLREFYGGLLLRESGIALVCVCRSTIVGLAAGPVAPRGYFRSLLKTRGLAFALAASHAALRNPLKVIPKLIGAITYRGDVHDAPDGACLLSSLCVAPSFQGRGLAGRLLEAFCDVARLRDATAVYLTTDADENVGPLRVYARSGFSEHARLRRRDGRLMLLLVKWFGERATSS
jgi:colanic acid biosynthesis glycosyl transferase WcaI